jgi:APA family basic amino acid/polyamine antiporter
MTIKPFSAKKIGFWASTAVIVGSMIGSGVFMKPSSMAEQLGSPIWLALVWIIAGLFSLFGALIYAELGAMMPETGGIYVYFRRMFGDFTAFLYGWAAFAVINTAAVAAIAFVCAEYADHFLHLPRLDPAAERQVSFHIPSIGTIYPLENIGVKSLAVFVVVALTFLNQLSIKAGGLFQVVSTFIKMAVIAGLVIGIFLSGNGSYQNFIESENPRQGFGLISGIIAAMTGAFFAYDGWINVTFIAGEIRSPQKNIPRSLITGVLACMIIYVAVNQAYLYVLPVEQVAQSTLVASDAIAVAWGNTSSTIIAAMIVVCTLGAVNGNIMATARVSYAMGKDRLFFSCIGKEHKRFATPGNALWMHGIWTCLYIITGSFNMLTDMFIFITWIAYGLGAVGIIMWRKRFADKHRPYKIWGYPWVPVLFILFTSFYLAMTIWSDVTNYVAGRQPIVNSLFGLIITAAGAPLYFYFKRKKDRVEGEPRSNPNVGY